VAGRDVSYAHLDQATLDGLERALGPALERALENEPKVVIRPPQDTVSDEVGPPPVTRFSFGREVRTRRCWLGWTYDELARIAGMGRTMVLAIERGEERPPHEMTVHQLATLLLVERAPFVALANASREAFDAWTLADRDRKERERIQRSADNLRDALASGFVIGGLAYAVAPVYGGPWLWATSLADVEESVSHGSTRTWSATAPVPRTQERPGRLLAHRPGTPVAQMLADMPADTWARIELEDGEEYEIRCLRVEQHHLETMGEFDGW